MQAARRLCVSFSPFSASLSFENGADGKILADLAHLSAFVIAVNPRGGIDEMIAEKHVVKTAYELKLTRRFVVRDGGETVSLQMVVHGDDAERLVFDDELRQFLRLHHHPAADCQS